MAASLESAKSRLLDEVVKDAARQAGAKEAKDAEAWARQLYAGAPPRDLLGDTAANLAGAALALWRHAGQRTPGQAKVRVYQPTQSADGWTCGHDTVVEAVNDDMPHLVDSLCAFLGTHAEVKLVVHPVMLARRDAAGRRTALCAAGSTEPGTLRESVIQVRLGEVPASDLATLQSGVEGVLSSVRRAMDDQPALRERLAALASDLDRGPAALPAAERAAAAGFLRWLGQNHFVLLGYREVAFDVKGDDARARLLPGAGLGLLRDEAYTLFDGLQRMMRLPEGARRALLQPEALRVAKASRRSPVHRAVPLDVISLPTLDAAGKVVGERCIIGLFALGVYTQAPQQIPYLAPKVEAVLARAGVPLDGHRGKQLRHVLETYPRDEMFQSSVDELLEIATGILDLQDRARVGLFTRRDPLGRFVSCLCYAPRDKFDSTLRKRFATLLEQAYGGKVDSFSTMAGDALARVHFLVTLAAGAPAEVDEAAVEERMREAARSWPERMQAAMHERDGSAAGRARAARFAHAFSQAYEERNDPATGAEDAFHVEEALRDGLALHLDRAPRAASSALRFKVYFTGAAVPLSHVLPMLENLGVVVAEEFPYEATLPDGGGTVRIREFEMHTADGRDADVATLRERFQDAFAQVWKGAMENDGLNRLVVAAGLSAREVTVLRGYAKYLRQAGIPFSEAYMAGVLARHAEVARLLVDLFTRRFDPARDARREADAKALVERIHARLATVTNLDDDRILRRFLNAIECTLRTNAFQRDGQHQPKAWLSFKLDSRRLDDLPLPRPFREIFVYSARFEAVHLRGGKVARGGLRWSDRREDFRTEVLGLMKAQQVKNAVIVPVGSKGGFVLKQAPEGRDALQAYAVDCYKQFLRGLLDITDNFQGAAVVAPRDVVRHDEDDPYLVVAADKGTATFSDHANSVSAEYGFWLGDAFASGGSAGYDHKAMGITARGGWEAVKRHFREMGKDIQAQDTTCVGVGDMSGDVFGNALLLSRHLRLVAAFDHRHVFVDPAPDPATSFAERERLFRLPRSSWADYDATKISKGGGVFDRKAKSVPVSPEMRTLLGLTADTATPADLMRAVLKADVELMWFGGIGTYVKASAETHADAGDRANDALRIDATELRVKVVGEGANLAMTQRARIEFGLAGGRLNTDAMDNSAGVDTSDHEVNIKIMLGDVVASGGLDRARRDELLKQMTDEVGALVLRDNYLQTQAITITHTMSARLLDRLGRFMGTLESQGKLNRRLEGLPDAAALRARRGVGLSRPELCVLLAYAKIDLYDALLASDLPDDPAMAEDLARYFPPVLPQRFPEAMARHRLRREIIATCITNQLVNRVGITFAHEVAEKTGATPADVARAFVLVREAFDLPSLWAGIEALDGRVPALEQARMLAEAGRMVERATVWLLREEARPLKVQELAKAWKESLAEAVRVLPEVLVGTARADHEKRAQAAVAAGVPAALAARVAALPRLATALDLVRLARKAKSPAAEVAREYFAAGERFGLDWLRTAALALPAESAWDKQAVTAVVDDLYAQQAALVASVLAGGGKGARGEVAAKAPTEALARWCAARAAQVERADQLLAELQAAGTPSLAMLAVANRALKTLAG
ncbi:MAG: NAD-glutamate dehydrogenase [Planctomycetia bacterium]